jgi:hypothetical protein
MLTYASECVDREDTGVENSEIFSTLAAAARRCPGGWHEQKHH